MALPRLKNSKSAKIGIDTPQSTEVKIVNKSNNDIPSYSTEHSAGMDLRAYLKLDNPLKIKSMERVMVPTGLYIELPEGYEAQVRPRSGLAIKNGITVINTPGTIDSDYRGEVCVLLVNLSKKTFEVHNGDRIAQMIINKYEKCKWIKVKDLSTTDRGEGGFNSTGIK